MSQPWRDESKLRESYLDLGTQKKVAAEFGCSKATIRTWMEKHGIEVRKNHPSCPLYHEDKLRSMYRESGSVERVRERLGCSPNTLKKWMDYHDIERDWKHKDRGEMVNAECFQCGESSITYKSIRNQFEKWFCSRDCMGNWQSENQVGEDSPSWEGGYTGYGSEWYYARKEVRERDGNVCQKCGDGDGERIPDVHHIERVRSFDDPDNAHSLDNLVQLCRSCHNKMEKYSPKKQREILDIN